MDHESSGAKEWHLEGYGPTSSKSRATALIQGVAGRIRESQSARSRAEINKQPPIHSNITAHRSRRGSKRANEPSRSGYRSTNRPSRLPATPDRASPLFHDSPSKSKWRSGSEPAGYFPLPAAFGSFKYEFFGVARSTLSGKKPSGSQSRYEVFEDINRRTGAHIKPPAYTDKIINIWGEHSQVTAAKQLLQNLLDKCSLAASNKKEWPRIPAENRKKEADTEWKERCELIVKQLRKEPESVSTFPEKLLFMWPKEGPPIEDALGPQLEALDIIRAKFNCPIFIPQSPPDHICALGLTHDTIAQIIRCLRVKWAETMANSNIKARVYVIEPPGPEEIRKTIVVKHENSMGTPRLQEAAMKVPELGDWQKRALLIKSKDHARILNAIEKALKGVVFVRGHLRMRANIGSFVLDKYRAPQDGKDSYSFEDFREMLSYEQTQGRLIPELKGSWGELLARCQATTLLEPLEHATASLDNMEFAYSVNFEFLDSNNAMLRLEVEFARRPSACEYEITQRRWLRPRKSGQSTDKQSPLQIGVIDFKRSDWQLEIKSLEFHEPSSIDSALREFSHAISFRHAAITDEISGTAQQRVNFKESPPVSRFVEKAAIQYRLKGTEYILEIARYDAYIRNATSGSFGTATGNESSHIPSTSWGASIFNPNWDNLFGEHANLLVGQSATYNPDLDTFFPPRDPDAKVKAASFWEFIDLVKQAAELLGPKWSPENQRKIVAKPLINEPHRATKIETEQAPMNEHDLLIDVSDFPSPLK